MLTPKQLAAIKAANEKTFADNPPYNGPNTCPFCFGKRYFDHKDGEPCLAFPCGECDGTGKSTP